MKDVFELTIAAQAMRGCIPADKPLRERILLAMRYVREHRDAVLFMSPLVDDDLMMRAALASIMADGSDQDRDIVERSLKPLKALSALMSGVPVNLEQVKFDDDFVPLLSLWHESGKARDVE